MKKSLALVLFCICMLITSASAETHLQDYVMPGDDIKDAAVLIKVEADTNNILHVGVDIPAGLYKFSAGYVTGYALPGAYFMFTVNHGTELIYKSEMLCTDDVKDMIIYIADGDWLIVATSGVQVVFVSSVDDVCLKRYE